MSHNPGNKKANQRKRRPTNQPGGKTPKAQAATQHDTTAEFTDSSTNKAVKTTQPAPQSSKTNKKAAAQAEAKKKKQMQMIIGGALAALAIALILIFVNRPTNEGVKIDFGNVAVSESQIVLGQGTPEADAPVGPLAFATGATVGDPNAPVTMHIFSDFQCHFCLQFHEETLPLVVQDFVRTGKLKLVFHDFPRLGTNQSIANPDDLTVELRDSKNESSLAAQAAMCAGEQNQYLQMSDKIFGNFGGVNQGAFSRAKLDRFAGDLGLNTDAFKSCMDSGRYIPALAQSIKQGQDNGISATPMFILDNGSGDLNVIQQTAEGYNLLKKQIETSIKTAP